MGRASRSDGHRNLGRQDPRRLWRPFRRGYRLLGHAELGYRGRQSWCAIYVLDDHRREYRHLGGRRTPHRALLCPDGDRRKLQSDRSGQHRRQSRRLPLPVDGHQHQLPAEIAARSLAGRARRRRHHHVPRQHGRERRHGRRLEHKAAVQRLGRSGGRDVGKSCVRNRSTERPGG